MLLTIVSIFSGVENCQTLYQLQFVAISSSLSFLSPGEQFKQNTGHLVFPFVYYTLDSFS